MRGIISVILYALVAEPARYIQGVGQAGFLTSSGNLTAPTALIGTAEDQ